MLDCRPPASASDFLDLDLGWDLDLGLGLEFVLDVFTDLDGRDRCGVEEGFAADAPDRFLLAEVSLRRDRDDGEEVFRSSLAMESTWLPVATAAAEAAMADLEATESSMV